MLGQRVVTVLVRFPTYQRLHGVLIPAKHSTTPSRLAIGLQVRRYAAVGRPRKAVGEPSSSAKRGVKQGTSKARARSSTASKKDKAKSKAKSTVKKTLKKPKKTLNKEQRATLRERKRKQQIEELKHDALKPPKTNTVTPYIELIREHYREQQATHQMAGKPTSERKEKFSQTSRELSSKWKNLSPAEIEHYNHVANVANKAKVAELRQWVQSHSVEEIVRANRARRRLNKIFPVQKGRVSKWPVINDERYVRAAPSAYSIFFSNRAHSGDFRNIRATETLKLVPKEWRELSQSEKQKYQDLYQRERERASHLNSPHKQEPHEPQALAAAA